MLLAFINKQDAFDIKNWFFCTFKWITDTKKLRKSKEMVIDQHSAFICNCAWELIKKIYRVQCFFLNVCDIITQFFVARARAIFIFPVSVH